MMPNRIGIWVIHVVVAALIDLAYRTREWWQPLLLGTLTTVPGLIFCPDLSFLATTCLLLPSLITAVWINLVDDDDDMNRVAIVGFCLATAAGISTNWVSVLSELPSANQGFVFVTALGIVALAHLVAKIRSVLHHFHPDRFF